MSDKRAIDQPRGVDHKPVVPRGQAHVLLLEPASTRNTGNVDRDYTIEPQDRQRRKGLGGECHHIKVTL